MTRRKLIETLEQLRQSMADAIEAQREFEVGMMEAESGLDQKTLYDITLRQSCLQRDFMKNRFDTLTTLIDALSQEN